MHFTQHKRNISVMSFQTLSFRPINSRLRWRNLPRTTRTEWSVSYISQLRLLTV